jgi:hypothetical protein
MWWNEINIGKLFTQRRKAAPLTLSKEITQANRNRILHLFEKLMQPHFSRYQDQYKEIASQLYGKYGMLKVSDSSSYRTRVLSAEVLMEHLSLCTNDEFLDFVEVATIFVDHRQLDYCVFHVNEIFREEGLSYVLTPYSESDVIDPVTGRKVSLKRHYPQIILVDNQLTHQEIVVPALNLLANPALSDVNQELLEAFHHVRTKKYADAITLAASSLESMFKVLFKREKMTLPKNAALGNLVTEFLNQNKLPKYYENSFFAVSKIRNEISTSHGRAGQQINPPTFCEAEHVVHLVASNIMFLARKFGFES